MADMCESKKLFPLVRRERERETYRDRDTKSRTEVKWCIKFSIA
jgi:hypothetical protein